MINDRYDLKDKSDTELHEWLIEQKPGADEYIAGEEESMRRVAYIQELLERKEAPRRKRELIAAGIAVLALAVAIIAVVFSY